MKSKNWWLSKTVWFNVITLIIGVVGAVVGVVRSEVWIISLTAINALGNGILRIWFTDTPIAKP
jgi:hypothetical protein